MSSIPDGLTPFLERAGWREAKVSALAGDASFRRYFRVTGRGERRAMLMHAPPPHEDPAPFLAVGRWLLAHGLRAPEVFAEDVASGFLLLEDFGDDRLREHLDAHPDSERDAYARAVDALVTLRGRPPGPFPPYDLEVYLREAELFTQWFCPAAGLSVDRDGWAMAWREVLTPLLARQVPGVTVLRDYHAENIMLLPDGLQGIIDFQDALVGHPAYDLVSLLQDARREVAEELERAMLERYVEAVRPGSEFAADYARLGAQRNAKIVGIFARLARRDNKPRYLAMIPRVWRALERDLAHPALAPVARWFDANIPAAVRDAHGGMVR